MPEQPQAFLMSHRKPRTGSGGRQPRFSADDAIDAALTLGVNDFSVSGVAKVLNVTAAAVYRRFPSRDALAESCLRRILSTAEPLDSDTDREQTIRSFAQEWWALTQRYPGLGAMAVNHRKASERLLDSPFRTHIDRLAGLGVSSQQSMFAAILIISMLHSIEEGTEPATAALANRQRHQTVDFIVTALDSYWPEWSMPIPCPAPRP